MGDDMDSGDDLPPVPQPAPVTKRMKDARRGAALLVVGGLVVPLAVIGLQLAGVGDDKRTTTPDLADRLGHLWTDATTGAPFPTSDPTESLTPQASTAPAATGSPAASSPAAGTTAPQPGATTTTTQPTPTGTTPPLIVDDFEGYSDSDWGWDWGWGSGSGSGWGHNRGRNDLGWTTECEAFVSCRVSGGALALTYDDDGWFGTYVNRNATEYTYLVLRIRGQHGGEEDDIRLTLGGAQRMLSDFTGADGGRLRITTSYRDLRIPLAANGISRTNLGELELDFWHGGASTVYIDEIRLA